MNILSCVVPTEQQQTQMEHPPASATPKPMFHPVPFSNEDMAVFNKDINGGVVCVAIDTSNPASPLWVNFAALKNFVKLHLYHWNRPIHANTPLAIEQRSIHLGILLKITHVTNLAFRHNCILTQWIDLRKLLKVTIATKMDNLYLATYPHHEYDILEIEKVGLEHAKVELRHDIIDEAHIKDVIKFSRLMAAKLYGLHFV